MPVLRGHKYEICNHKRQKDKDADIECESREDHRGSPGFARSFCLLLIFKRDTRAVIETANTEDHRLDQHGATAHYRQFQNWVSSGKARHPIAAADNLPVGSAHCYRISAGGSHHYSLDDSLSAYNYLFFFHI